MTGETHPATSASETPTPAPDGGAETPSPKTKKKGRAKRKGPMTVAQLFGAVARRPLLIVVGMIACAVAALLEAALGQSGDALFNLVSYLPFLGGAWAVWAAERSTPDAPRGHIPGQRRLLAFAATAVVLVVLSGLARVTLTVLGEMVVKTALALGPIVALAESSWPHHAFWRGLMVIDGHPRDFLKVAALSLVVLVLTVMVVPLVVSEVFGGPSGGELVRGAARGLGWALISAIWMRFYLRVRASLAQ